jgi:hypothetical protein
MFVFEAVVASRGYHVYKNTSWSEARTGEFVKVEVETSRSSKREDPYACAIRTKHFYYDVWRTVGHIPREISRHVFYFLTTERGLVSGHVQSIDQRYSPIPAGGLEIPLKLRFSCETEFTLSKMKTFVTTLYDYNFTGMPVNEEDEEEGNDMELLIQDDPEDFREENVSAVGTSEDGQNHVKEGSSNDDDVEDDIQFCSEPIPVDSKIDIVVIDID